MIKQERRGDGGGVAAACAQDVAPWQRRDDAAIDPADYKAWCADRLDALMAQPLHIGPSSDPFGGIAADQMALSPALVKPNEARALILRGATLAERLVEHVDAGELRLREAYDRLAAIIIAALGPVAEVCNALADADASRTIEKWRPDIVAALDKIGRAAILLRKKAAAYWPHALDEKTSLVAMDAQVQSLGTVSAPLGWTPTAELGKANERRYAHEACPTGGRDERPDHCDLPDVEREAMRRGVVQRIVRAIAAFARACAPHKKALEKMIAEDKARQKLVTDIVQGGVKTALNAASGGGGTLVKLGIDVAMSLAKAELDWTDADAREGTVSAIDALVASLTVKAWETEADMIHLDDVELRAADGALAALDVPFFAPRVADFVERYRDQIEVIGGPRYPRSRGDRYFGPGNGGRVSAVWIVTEDRKHRRMALCEDQSPGERPYYNFMRWVDADLVSVAGGSSLLPHEVEVRYVHDLPLLEMMSWYQGASR